jgi:hypothetical protein
MNTHSTERPRELSGQEIEQVSGGEVSNTQIVVAIAAPGVWAIVCLSKGMFGENPFNW